jgi:hypothetical protein
MNKKIYYLYINLILEKMKKVSLVCLSLALLMSLSGCSSLLGTSSSSEQSTVSSVLQTLLLEYLMGTLGTDTALSSSLNKATASTTLSSILGGSTTKTDLLTSLVSSKFSIPQASVKTAVTSSNSTLGSLATFIGQNSNASTLSNVLGVKL